MSPADYLTWALVIQQWLASILYLYTGDFRNAAYLALGGTIMFVGALWR